MTLAPTEKQPSPNETWSPLDFDRESFRVSTVEGSFKRFARNGVRTSTMWWAAGASPTRCALTMVYCSRSSIAYFH